MNTIFKINIESLRKKKSSENANITGFIEMHRELHKMGNTVHLYMHMHPPKWFEQLRHIKLMNEQYVKVKNFYNMSTLRMVLVLVV